ncbi:MAG: hypothetical protein V9E82_15155 [Candidatus Nanopelagicales bacterium]
MSNPITGHIGDNRPLPPHYRTALSGVQRSLTMFDAVHADSANSPFEDLADLFGQAAADGAIREVGAIDEAAGDR